MSTPPPPPASAPVARSAPSPKALHERTRWVFEHLPADAARLLDAGCHDGSSTAAFRTRVGMAVGIDLDQAAIQRGHRRFAQIKLLTASGADLPFRDDAFDCVVFSEVLEHVPETDEARCIAELHRVTRPSGTLILTTPHRGTFWWLDPLMFKTHLRRLAGMLRRRPAWLKGHKHYRVHELQALIEPHFEIRSIDRVGCLLYPLAYWGHLLPFGIGGAKPLVALWQRMMDHDYLREYGAAAYNVCIVATAREG
jgi:ubiquinone/menaquinone biosynthesis C-methylase UbiE